MRFRFVFLFVLLAGGAGASTLPEFGAPSGPGRVIVDAPTGGVTSPALTDDELEIVFESLGNLWSATRTATTLPFENSHPIAELSSTEYAEERPFLTKDGLGLYFTRYRTHPTPSRKIYYARRPQRTGPFGPPMEVGIEGVELLNGALGSVSGDELSVYLEIVRESEPGSGLPEHTDIAVATRTSTAEPFGMWRFLGELNTSNLERAPSITRDERTLYFTVQGVGSPGFLFGSTRPDKNAPFPAPCLVEGVNTAGIANRDPFIAFPGSRLYFIQNEELVFADRILSGTYGLGEASGMTGRRVLFPITLATPEPDAVLFETPIFFNPTRFLLRDVIPNPSLGVSRLEYEEISQGRYRILYEALQPLEGKGEEETILQVEFLVEDETPVGQHSIAPGGTFRLNNIEVPPASDGKISVEPGPSYPAATLWRLR